MEPLLIPVQRLEETGGRYSLPKACRIGTITDEDRLPVLQLIDELSAYECTARLTANTADAHVLLVRNKAVANPQGYRLRVSEGGVTVEAATAAGVFYGVQTLRELIRAHGLSLPTVTVEDWPTCARRGVYIDCSRGKVPTVATVKALVQRLAAWKINEVQLYVENVFTFPRHPAIGRGFSPFTPEDLIDLGAFCRHYHVHFVPSLTSLGHFEKILMLDEYRDLGELQGFRDLPGGTTICPVDPRSIELVGDMYDEFLPLFDADDFNACGDEPWELGQGRSKEEAERVGVGQVYLDFALKLRERALAKGKRFNLWGDIVLKHPEIIPQIPRDVVLLNWDYQPDGERMNRTREFTEAGLPLVCCPGTHGWQSHGTRLETSFQNISNFARVAEEHDAEGLLNTDWGDQGHRNTIGVSMHGFALGAAHSWNTAGASAWSLGEFLELFSRRVFGEATLAPVLETIGNDDYGNWAYHALLEKLGAPEGLGLGFCAGRPRMEATDLGEPRIDELASAADAMRVPDPGNLGFGRETGELPEFERLMLREYSLANLMNRAALDRLRFARTVRAGGTLDSAAKDAHAAALAQVRDELCAVWMQRNRPSRLADSLAGLDEAIAEVKGL